MTEKLKIQEHFSRLRVEVGYSIEDVHSLNDELNKRLVAFETSVAPAKKLFPNEERYWIAKTIIILDYLKESLPDKNLSPEGVLLSCGYDHSEIDKVKWAVDRRLERRVLGNSGKSI